MALYLDPKADLTFRRVFGENPHLLISFLNAMLPLAEDEQVTSVQYLTPEMVPENPGKKNSIVDVRCTDQRGRQFIVEMQMVWSSEFKQRVLFNAAKAYVRQIGSNAEYRLLEPVYSLNIVNESFERDMPETFYHHYQLVHSENSQMVIDGFQLIFVELPKFKPKTFSDKKMQVLWLRFLTEINDTTREAPADLTSNPQISEALEIVRESAFSDSELLGYDKFWDAVRVERTLYNSAERNGIKIGLDQAAKRIASKMKAKGAPIEEICDLTGLTADEIDAL